MNSLGWSGLKWVTDIINGHQNFYDLGYRLQRDFGTWIYQSAIMALDYGFNILQIDKINASANCENIGSNRILTKLGMDCLNTFIMKTYFAIGMSFPRKNILLKLVL